ncbi:MAG: hypothetical protein OEZ01_05295 [Candidatus Heimdallarchaeota archaeon]|nr:hypothetical protein [Candidatus Heimdallarchaeota archaeon]MDH5645398.1 hypothetical protein [Candidatus Heimdallarchaeota archaeon]
MKSNVKIIKIGSILLVGSVANHLLSFIVRIRYMRHDYLKDDEYAEFLLGWISFQIAVLLIHLNLYAPMGSKYQSNMNKLALQTDISNILKYILPWSLIVAISYYIVLSFLGLNQFTKITFSIAVIFFGIFILIQSLQKAIGQFSVVTLEFGSIGFLRLVFLIIFLVLNLKTIEIAIIIYLLPIICISIISLILFKKQNQMNYNINSSNYKELAIYLNQSKWVIISDITFNLTIFMSVYFLKEGQKLPEIELFDVIITSISMISLLITNYGYAILLKAPKISTTALFKWIFKRFAFPFTVIAIIVGYIIHQFQILDYIITNIIKLEFESSFVLIVLLSLTPIIQTTSIILSSYIQGRGYFSFDSLGRVIGLIMALTFGILNIKSLINSFIIIFIYFLFQILFISFFFIFFVGKANGDIVNGELKTTKEN